MSAPYRDPDHPLACERCAARDKRAADVRRVATRVAYGVSLACVLLLMVAHTTFVVVACAYVTHDTGAFHAALLLLTMPIRLAGTNRARRIGNSRTVPTGMFLRRGPRHDAREQPRLRAPVQPRQR